MIRHRIRAVSKRARQIRIGLLAIRNKSWKNTTLWRIVTTILIGAAETARLLGADAPPRCTPATLPPPKTHLMKIGLFASKNMTQEDRRMPLRPLTPTAVATAVAIALLNASTVRAEGFAVPEMSVAGVGTANALVANPEERGAFIYNPAAMAFHTQSSIAAGILLINPNFSVKTASGKHDSTGADWIGAPMGQLAIRINQQWSAGLGVSAPFGLETKWETGTFPPLTNTAPLPTPPFAPGTSIPLSPQPTRSKARESWTSRPRHLSRQRQSGAVRGRGHLLGQVSAVGLLHHQTERRRFWLGFQRQRDVPQGRAEPRYQLSLRGDNQYRRHSSPR